MLSALLRNELLKSNKLAVPTLQVTPEAPITATDYEESLSQRDVVPKNKKMLFSKLNTPLSHLSPID